MERSDGGGDSKRGRGGEEKHGYVITQTVILVRGMNWFKQLATNWPRGQRVRGKADSPRIQMRTIQRMHVRHHVLVRLKQMNGERLAETIRLHAFARLNHTQEMQRETQRREAMSREKIAQQ